MFFTKVLAKFRTLEFTNSLIRNANSISFATDSRRHFNTSQHPKKREWKSYRFSQCQPRKRVFMDPRGKVTLITGGVTGIGIAVAYELLNAGGCAVINVGPECSDHTGAVRALNAKFGKGKALYIPVDTAFERDFKNLFDQAICRYNRIDILFNNGGVWNDTEWETCIDTNIGGTIRGNLLAFEFMSKSRKGKNKGCGGLVVNCASTLAFDAMPACPAFCASQHAIVGLSQCLGDPFHVKRTNIRVMSLCPDVAITNLSFNDPKHQHALGLCLSSHDLKEKRNLPNTYAAARAFLYLVKYGVSSRHYVVDGAVMREVTYPPIAEFGRPVCCYKKKRLFGLI